MSDHDASESPSVVRRWTWTVANRFEVSDRGIVVTGEHVGEYPVLGESCTLQDTSGTVEAFVAGLERFHHREGGQFTGHSWGLLLGGVAIQDVRVGAVVSPADAD